MGVSHSITMAFVRNFWVSLALYLSHIARYAPSAQSQIHPKIYGSGFNFYY